MSAQATGDLPALWQRLRDVGLQEVAPVLVQLTIRGVEELASRASVGFSSLSSDYRSWSCSMAGRPTGFWPCRSLRLWPV